MKKMITPTLVAAIVTVSVIALAQYTKKNEVFSFKIWDGKVSRISRPSTNTLPTNDVWTAFQIIQLKEYLGDMETLIQQLRKKYSSKIIKR